MSTDIEAAAGDAASTSGSVPPAERPRMTASEDEIRKALGGLPKKPPEMDQQPEPKTVAVPV